VELPRLPAPKISQYTPALAESLLTAAVKSSVWPPSRAAIAGLRVTAMGAEGELPVLPWPPKPANGRKTNAAKPAITRVYKRIIFKRSGFLSGDRSIVEEIAPGW